MPKILNIDKKFPLPTRVSGFSVDYSTSELRRQSDYVTIFPDSIVVCLYKVFKDR